MRTDLYQGHDYYLLDDLLTEEHKLIRETARARARARRVGIAAVGIREKMLIA